VEYRTAYRESAVVKNALQQRQYTKGNIAALVVWSASVVWRSCGWKVVFRQSNASHFESIGFVGSYCVCCVRACNRL
jgi:hypothetical protein